MTDQVAQKIAKQPLGVQCRGDNLYMSNVCMCGQQINCLCKVIGGKETISNSDSENNKRVTL